MKKQKQIKNPIKVIPKSQTKSIKGGGDGVKSNNVIIVDVIML